jgi:hypothetical protein
MICTTNFTSVLGKLSLNTAPLAADIIHHG